MSALIVAASASTLIATQEADAKNAGASAPIHRAANPIRDAQGRIEIIVDFDFDAENDKEFDENITDEEAGKYKGRRPKAVKFLNKFEKKYGLTRTGMTSWTTTSTTAFVTEDQLQKIAKEKRVTLVTENSLQSFSSFFQATDTITNGESASWGQKLTTNNTILSGANSQRTVYVIDSGVADHDDLNVVARVNVACGNGTFTCSTRTVDDAFPPVGCYPHSTHVAGIIGARASNGKTSVGIYPGVKIVSVTMNKPVGTSFGKCARHDNFDAAGVGYALDWVYKDQRIRRANGDALVGIVNASFNSGGFGFDSNGVAETNRAKMLRLVAPDSSGRPCAPVSRSGIPKTCALVPYQGAFFVQSAGNEIVNTRGNQSGAGRNVCSEFRLTDPQTGLTFGPSQAYTQGLPNGNATNPSDGIMVVGAFHSDGVPADSATQRPFSPSVPAATADTSSNYGPCIDIWAPGNAIYSTWCDHNDPNEYRCKVGTTYSGNGTTGSRGWSFLSGTSMAAPHVAGAAAYLADSLGLTSPAAIEAAARAQSLPVRVPDLPDRSGTAVRFVRIP